MVQDRTRPEGAAETAPVRGARRSRRGLFLPYILLALVVVGWSAGWLWMRERAASEIDGWIAKARPAVSAALNDKAKRVVARVQSENSEMVELWQESDEFDAWKAEVGGLLQRLS